MIGIWKSPFWGFLLWPFSLLYRLGLFFRKKLYGWGIFTSVRLNTKVISVGNITVGGTGKTPCVEKLARLLKEKGYRVAIISRGFGRKGRGTVVVSNSKKVNVTAKESGDEPALLAKNLNEIPVIVEKNRAKAGYLAMHTWKTDILLLDDSFQNRQIKKDLDLVTIDSTNLWGNGRLLPAGPLREPLYSLKRADGIILTRTNESSINNKGEKRIRKFTDAPIFWANHEPRNFISLQDDRTCKLNILKDKKVLGFSGIGNPDSFKKTLHSIGVKLLDHIVFRDHYWYKPKDLKSILKTAETKKAEALVTTEKDHVRLPLDWYPSIPTYYLKIEFEIQKGFEEFISLLDSIFISEKSKEA